MGWLRSISERLIKLSQVFFQENNLTLDRFAADMYIVGVVVGYWANNSGYDRKVNLGFLLKGKENG